MQNLKRKLESFLFYYFTSNMTSTFVILDIFKNIFLKLNFIMNKPLKIFQKFKILSDHFLQGFTVTEKHNGKICL